MYAFALLYFQKLFGEKFSTSGYGRAFGAEGFIDCPKKLTVQPIRGFYFQYMER